MTRDYLRTAILLTATSVVVTFSWRHFDVDVLATTSEVDEPPQISRLRCVLEGL